MLIYQWIRNSYRTADET